MNPINRCIARLIATCAVTLAVFAVPLVRHSSAEEPAKPTKDVTIELLFVQNSPSGSFDGKRLTLKEVGPTIYFSDRPYRLAGHVHTAEFIGHWGKGSDNFEDNPPNATLSIFGREGVVSVVVELTGPKLDGHTLSYNAKVLQGQLPPSFDESSLFIDIFGRWRMYAYGRAAGAATATAAMAATHAVYTPPVVVAAPAPVVYTVPAPIQEPAPRPPPPPAVNVTVTTPDSPAAAGVSGGQAAAIAKLKELKGLLSQGLISESQYQQESQKLLNEIMQ